MSRQSQLPAQLGNMPWLQMEKVSLSERLEIAIYKFISIFPVFVTFGLFTYLFSFYLSMYTYMGIMGDYSIIMGKNYISPYWNSDEEMESHRKRVIIEFIIFMYIAVMLLIAIIKTILINPGNIPTDKEWDIITSDSAIDNISSLSSNHSDISELNQSEIKRNEQGIDKSMSSEKRELMINNGIEEDQEYPKEPAHLDYRYLRTYAGPLAQQPIKKTFLQQIKEDEEKEKKRLIKGKHHKDKKPIIKKSYERKKMGGIRMCQRCLRSKPDRCHHCSQCNKCILKMDHHCPWVANCIGFYNYKFFLNMLFYTSFSSIMMIVDILPLVASVLEPLTNSDDNYLNLYIQYYIFTSFVLNFALSFIITGFMIFHITLIWNGRTTIEFCEKRSNDTNFYKISPFNIGKITNFQIILGKNPCVWLIPFFPNYQGNGLQFQINKRFTIQGQV